MSSILVAVFFVAAFLRVAENLLDLAVITLTRWLTRRRIPTQRTKVQLSNVAHLLRSR